MTEKLRVEISAEDRFSRVFGNLRRDLSTAHEGVTRLVSSLPGLAGLGGAAGLGVAAGAVRRFANDLDALNDAADATGSTVELLSALEDVSRRNGGTLDLVTGSIVRMNAVLKDATPGSALEKTLKGIGLSASDLRQQDPAQALRTLALALAEGAEDGNKARLTQELFGKSLKDVAPFLKDIVDAGELNTKVTTAQAAAAERFNKELARLQTEVSDAGRGITSVLLPAINRLLSEVGGAAGNDPRGSAIGRALLVPLQAVSVAGANVAFVFRGVGTEIGGIAAQIAALSRGDFDGFRAIGRAMKEDAAAARLELERLERALLGVTTGQEDSGVKPPGRRLPDVAGGGGGGPPKAQLSEAQRYLETLQRQVEAFDKLNAAQQLQRDLEARRIDGVTPRIEAQLRAEASKLDLLRQIAVERERELDFAKLIASIEQREVNAGLDLLDSTPTGQRERIARDLERVQRVARANPGDEIVQRKAGEATDRLRKELKDLDGVTKKVPTEFERMADAIEKSMERSTDALLDFILEAKGTPEQIAKAFSRDILRGLIEAPLRDSIKSTTVLLRRELAGLFGGSKAWSGWKIDWSEITKSFGGFNWASLLGSFTTRANGGDVRAGQLVRWQEGGREWFSPSVDGTVATERQMRSAATASPSFSTVINVNGDASTATVRLIDQAIAYNNARLLRSMRTGAVSSG